jgi:hypothetical protein
MIAASSLPSSRLPRFQASLQLAKIMLPQSRRRDRKRCGDLLFVLVEGS